MVRVLASLLLALTLPACAITPPSSLFTSLADQQQSEEPHAAPAQRRTQHASFSNSLGSIWDSVKSGIGLDNTIRTTTTDNTPVQALNPQEAQRLLNIYRAQKGLSPVKLNAKLTAAATKHAEDLARNDRLSHYGSDGSDAWERVQRTGYPARRAAENVGRGQRTLGEILDGWQKSRDHNANLLLADADEMGIAMAYNPDTQFKTYWALVLGSKE